MIVDLYSFEDGLYELFDAWLIVGVSGFYLSLCDNAADGHGFMSHVQSESGDARTLHLVVRDALSLISKIGNAFIDIGYGNVDTEYASLRAIEAVGCDGASTHHIVSGYAVH